MLHRTTGKGGDWLEKRDIENKIVDAYMRGIHGNLERETIQEGFHEDFCMYIEEREGTIEEWRARMEELRSQNPELWKENTTHLFHPIDVTSDDARVERDVHNNTAFLPTDYMLLNGFKNGWKIVSRIFNKPG
jgi:hypothetical protein